MRDLLHRIRQRVERLAAGVPCEDLHQLTKISRVEGGDPKPAWPPRGRADLRPLRRRARIHPHHPHPRSD